MPVRGWGERRGRRGKRAALRARADGVDARLVRAEGARTHVEHGDPARRERGLRTAAELRGDLAAVRLVADDDDLVAAVRDGCPRRPPSPPAPGARRPRPGSRGRGRARPPSRGRGAAGSRARRRAAPPLRRAGHPGLEPSRVRPRSGAAGRPARPRLPPRGGRGRAARFQDTAGLAAASACRRAGPGGRAPGRGRARSASRRRC